VLFVFAGLSHDRRCVVHFNVTEQPTEAWTAQQIREAFPWGEALRSFDPRQHTGISQGAIDMMALTIRTADVFMIQPTNEKQAFLRLVLKSATWRHGELQTQFEEPFENLKRSNQLSRRKDTEIGDGTTRNQIWLPESDITRNRNGSAPKESL